MRFSVIIPTYQRRETVVRTIVALNRQTERDFETVVVVDGSTDGTAIALANLSLTFPLIIIEQPNRGLSAARNAGARAAGGDVLLLLDDDMEPDARLLAQHLVARELGADVVLGHFPLHPSSPSNFLCDVVNTWTRDRVLRLSAPNARFTADDYLMGQSSVTREIFWAVGGFDESLTRDGLYGGEDLDFGYRLIRAGYKLVFAPEAIAHHFYDVDPEDYLRRRRQAGRSYQELIFRHPAWASDLGQQLRYRTPAERVAGWVLMLAPPGVMRRIHAGAAALVRAGRRGPATGRSFSALADAELKRGAREARRAWRKASVSVLAYHAVADLSEDPVVARFAVPPALLASQLDHLLACGRTFVDLETVLRGLTQGSFIPKAATLLTFDDGYADLLEVTRSILEPRGIPAVVFAVSGEIGGTNSWDRRLGAGPLPLLGRDALRALSDHGVTVGSHSVTHRSLVSLDTPELEAELRESADQLESIGLPRPVAVAYPYGHWDRRVASAAHAAGYSLGFTISSGIVRRDAPPHALPRIEVIATDTPRDLTAKMATAGCRAWGRSLAFRSRRNHLSRLSSVPGTVHRIRDRVRPRSPC